MRGAFGKPNGLVARVNIGQILMSIRTRPDKVEQTVAALTRAKYKFPGRQRVVISGNWGFTNLKKEEYLELQEANKLIPDGVNIKVVKPHGALSKTFPMAEGIKI